MLLQHKGTQGWASRQGNRDAEEMWGTDNFQRRNDAFDILLKLYADIGEKDEIYRIWNRYKEMGIIYNKGYKTLISALLKLDQVEGAEKIFEEWHSKKLSYDTRIPKLLIDVYSQKGLLGKAESLMDHAQAKGAEKFGWWMVLFGKWVSWR